MSIIIATVVVVVVAIVVAIVGFYLLAAFIVHTTGETTGIADIGRAAAAILAAVFRHHR
ncbi:hypothetical protein QDT91_29900 (plasmid) [Mycolicibacterium aubagnense]|uniref:hypothetical protein n=1 Tax=Mycolicibacterium aubagnense TaxID=319707 RepID=UPI00244DE840|nr:hypothetical protein [Mycolicibacterium aubagnense]WGI36240.1 hypothetical protein QDT91_29900 [Mycolicibacterium aubagnense]